MKKLFWLCFALALSSGLTAQDLSRVIEQAQTLTALLEQIEQANNEQRELLRDLNRKLLLSETDVQLLREISAAQGNYVNRLLEEMKTRREIYEAQLVYQKKLQLRSKVLTVSLAVGLPAAASLGIWAGLRLAR